MLNNIKLNNEYKINRTAIKNKWRIDVNFTYEMTYKHQREIATTVTAREFNVGLAYGKNIQT